MVAQKRHTRIQKACQITSNSHWQSYVIGLVFLDKTALLYSKQQHLLSLKIGQSYRHFTRAIPLCDTSPAYLL